MLRLSRAAAGNKSAQRRTSNRVTPTAVDVPENEKSGTPENTSKIHVPSEERGKYCRQTCLLVGVTEIGPAVALEAEARSHRAPEKEGKATVKILLGGTAHCCSVLVTKGALVLRGGNTGIRGTG